MSWTYFTKEERFLQGKGNILAFSVVYGVDSRDTKLYILVLVVGT